MAGGGIRSHESSVCVCAVLLEPIYTTTKMPTRWLDHYFGPHGCRGAGVHPLAGLGPVGQGVSAGGLG